jgi:L-ascorbate metabolism protein UlaG (beta-lactamase superfamily)
MADRAVMGRPAEAADRIVFLGHATFLIELDGVRLLTDPLLRSGVAHLRRQVPPVDPSVLAGWAGWAGPHAVLISHLHRDHLDLASLRLLGLDTPMLVPAGAGKWMRSRGFTSVTELSVGEVANVGALDVSAVEARHDGHRRRGPGALRAETLGYVVSGRRRVYFAGDTELFQGMSDLVGQLTDETTVRSPTPGCEDMSEMSSRLDVALLPVAGWGPTLGPGHMGPLDAARAAGLLRPRVAIPMHWGTLLPIGAADRQRARLDDPPRVFAEHVASLAPSVEVRILMPGQETTL